MARDMADLCNYGNKPPGSVKREEFPQLQAPHDFICSIKFVNMLISVSLCWLRKHQFYNPTTETDLSVFGRGWKNCRRLENYSGNTRLQVLTVLIMIRMF